MFDPAAATVLMHIACILIMIAQVRCLWYNSFAMDSYAYQSTPFWQRLRGHFTTVCIHKKYVAQGCFRLGLYRQGLFHDLSKFTPLEFGTGVRYYDGHRSPNAVERLVNDGCSESWLHHKGRNKHHFEYWIDYSNQPGRLVYGNKMPMRYLAEMVCDRRAACIAYNRDNYQPSMAWDHYIRCKDHSVLHRDTRLVLEKALCIMRDEGEDACFAYLRKLLKQTKGTGYSADALGIEDNMVDHDEIDSRAEQLMYKDPR